MALGQIDDHEWGACSDLRVLVHVDLTNGTGELRGDRGLHLHRFDHRETITLLDVLPGFDQE